jgi:hypothetical protein
VRGRSLLVVAGVVAGAAVAEALVRVARPSPRAQIVRPDMLHGAPELVDGEPLWRAGQDDDTLRNEGCPGPGTLDVAFAWDSIGYDVERVGAEALFPAQVGRALRDEGRPVCVLNLSEPAYRAGQQLAETRRAHARHGLDVVVVGAWKRPASYTRFGEAWIVASDRETDRLGTPRLPFFPLPEAHRWLFTHSRAWQYATLALAPTRREPAPGVVRWEAFATWAAEAGVRLVVVHPAPLDRPFAETAAQRAALAAGGPGDDGTGLEGLRAAGVPVHDAAALLAGRDVEALRLDRCCHLNRAGQAVFAEALLPLVRGALPPR